MILLPCVQRDNQGASHISPRSRTIITSMARVLIYCLLLAILTACASQPAASPAGVAIYLPGEPLSGRDILSADLTAISLPPQPFIPAEEIISYSASAHDLALGACWLCAPLFCGDAVRTTLDFPIDWEAQALITIGYPTDQGRSKDRVDFKQKTIYR